MSLVDRAIRLGMRRGLDRGIGEGKTLWLVVGGGALLLKLGRRAMHREPEVVFSEKLKPGESFRITHEAQG